MIILTILPIMLLAQFSAHGVLSPCTITGSIMTLFGVDVVVHRILRPSPLYRTKLGFFLALRHDPPGKFLDQFAGRPCWFGCVAGVWGCGFFWVGFSRGQGLFWGLVAPSMFVLRGWGVGGCGGGGGVVVFLGVVFGGVWVLRSNAYPPRDFGDRFA